MTDTFRIAIAGLGTVGLGAYKVLTQNADDITQKIGRNIKIIAVAARDKSKDRGVSFSSVHWYENAVEIAGNPDVDLVVELIGGESGTAYDLVKNSLLAGKHVVTANKAMMAKHGAELARIAEDKKVFLGFEAAVAGGIPVIKVLQESLSGNKVVKLQGIVNGTCNYILTAMEQEGAEFADVLKKAQELGYAETPPDLDVDGYDAAHKTALLAACAFGTYPNLSSIYIEGIRQIDKADFLYASRMGYTIRLVGTVRKHAGNVIEQRVHPLLVKSNSQLAQIKGVTNAVLIEAEPVGNLLLSGPGAGQGPTSSSVLADILDIAAGRGARVFGISAAKLAEAEAFDMGKLESEYYFRLKVQDKPGVLAKITALLEKHNISIGQIQQNVNEADSSATLAIITHETVEKIINQALSQLNSQDFVLEKASVIRVG